MKDYHTLYLCYFGLREPLVQTQVISYIREMSKDGIKVSLLTFEPNFKESWTKEQIENQKRDLAEEGINWYCLPYHKSPSVPATLFDVSIGVRFIKRLMKSEKINVLHARAHVPALMAALAKKLSTQKPKIVFDIRGFIPEEYTDAGIWKEKGRLYHSVKSTEKWLLQKSDAFVVLTERAREILFPESKETGFDKLGRPVEVIPCCVDLQRFQSANEESRTEIRQKLNLDGRRVFVYVGSFGGWYLTDEMLDFFLAARDQDEKTFIMILTQRDTEKVFVDLKKRGFAEEDFFVGSVPPKEIPKYLSASDVALSFIKNCYSKQASSPTKIAEYLASGLPIISNRGIGDVDELLTADRVGVLLEDFSKDGYLKALDEIEKLKMENDLPNRCRQSATKRFDLREVGAAKYRFLYQRLFQRI